MDARERHLLRHIHNYCDLILDDNINIVHELLTYSLVSPFFMMKTMTILHQSQQQHIMGHYIALSYFVNMGLRHALPTIKTKRF